MADETVPEQTSEATVPQEGQPVSEVVTPPASPSVARLAPEDLAAIGTAVAQGIVGASQALRPANAIPTIEDVSDDEINSAVQRGENVAHLIRKAANATTQREKRSLEQRIAQLEESGSRAIGMLVRQNLGSRKYYGEYKNEIDAMLASLPAQAQADPNTVDYVYKTVIGSHAEDIERRAEERSARQARESAPSQPTGGTGGRGTGEPELRAEDILDPEAIQAAKQLGGLEHYARVAGYPDLQTFLQQRKARNEGSVQ